MSLHATEPTALGTFFTYPQDAQSEAGAVAPYWFDAGGTRRVRMTGACKRAFLATVEALLERAVIPANFGDAPASTSGLATATYHESIAPYSLVDLETWADAVGRNAIGTLLTRGLPYGAWERLVSLTWGLFRKTSKTVGPATVLAWQNGLFDFATSGFVDEDDSVWSQPWSRDWGGAAADQDALDYGEPFDHPWGPYPGGGSGSSVVVDALQGMIDSLMTDISVGGGSGNLLFVDDALSLQSDFMQFSGISVGNWFTDDAGHPVGTVTSRRSGAAWGILQAMLAQMKYTHLRFPFEIEYEHVEETRIVGREVGWDSDEMNWTCDETDDNTTTTTSLLYNQIESRRGYGTAGGTAPEVTLSFAVDSLDTAAMSALALPAPPQTVGDDGPYAVVGRTPIYYCTVVNSTPQTWTKSASRQYATGVSGARADVAAYPASALRGYVSQYGKVHFVGSLHYTNASTHAEWKKFCVRQETGKADLDEPVTDFASWLISQVPRVSLPPISSFDQSAFDSAVDSYWDAFTAVYPTAPNCTVDGVPMYFPVGFYGYNQSLQTIEFDSSDKYFKGQIRLGYGDVEAVFPHEGAEAYGYAALCAPDALAGFKWQFKAMPTAN